MLFDEDPARVTERAERDATVRLAVQKLPREYANALFKYYFEGMSVKETGQSIGKSENATKQLLYRARKRLAEVLRMAGFG